MSKINIREILLGIAIGDAFGAGVEFQDRSWIRRNVDFTKFVNARHLIKVPIEKLKTFTENYRAWDYTDDTEMTIGVLKALVSEEPFSESLLVKSWQEEYLIGIDLKGYGRNGHGSMAWFYDGKMTINEVRDFQRERKNPGNAPATRSVLFGLISSELINQYAEINAMTTHPNENAVLSSQSIARATEFLIVKKGEKDNLISYVKQNIQLNSEYRSYYNKIDQLGDYASLSKDDFAILCGQQPIQEPYFLPGINGMPSDSKFTAGCVLYILKQAKSTMEALKMSIYLGGDVDSVAA